jgi:DNA-binding transcriptional regulator YhcF (GntR family)
MIVTVDPDNAVPPYEQIRSQIETMVRAGTLSPGAPLPPIRRLAADLGVASGTVARAYRELELAEIVITRGRHGTHVAEVPPGFTPAQLRARLSEAARTYAGIGRQMGVPVDELVAVLRAESART